MPCREYRGQVRDCGLPRRGPSRMWVPFRRVCTGAFSPREGLDFHQILGGQCVCDDGGQGGGIFSQGLGAVA